jgi:hypothetical protein
MFWTRLGYGVAAGAAVLQLQEETRQLQAELARLRELTGDPAPAERSRRQRHPQAAGE